MRRFVVAGAVALLAVPVAAGADAGVSSAGRHKCHTYAYETVYVFAARNMSCRAAKRDIRRSGNKVATRRYRSARGFRCKRYKGGELAGLWRCRKGRRLYRYSFSD
jgi:hypothetical protein